VYPKILSIFPTAEHRFGIMATMTTPSPLRQRWHTWLDRLTERLARPDAQVQLAVLALIVGLIAGLVIVAFRGLIELGQTAFLPGGRIDDFEALPMVARFLLPTLGGLIIGLALHWIARERRGVGVVHVMERLAYYQGRLPLANALVEFFGAAFCIIVGQSVGREGPAVHLGAASGSQLGQRLRLPTNSIRTLVACGVAAAIAASFNTPLAGVIFAMEVVMMEYTLLGFAPVILAAVSATTLSRAIYGSAPAFAVPPLDLGSLWELPNVVMMGLVLGVLAALFIHSLQWFTGLLRESPIWQRATLGGALVGLCALSVPQVMGIGYDTVNQALVGEVGLTLMLAVVLAKTLATAAALGLGLPGGLIGPTLVIGAAAGGALGHVSGYWLPEELASPAFYALIGMGAMMGATLQAPLAALTAMLELTANPHIILPGMLALITAGMVSKELFRKDSVFLMLLRARGLDYRNDPLMQALRRIGVAGTMDRRFVDVPATLERTEAERVLAQEPRWLLVRTDQDHNNLLAAADLARLLEQQPEAKQLDLEALPARRLQAVPVDFGASLQEAWEALEAGAEAIYVVRRTVPGIERVYGVLTRQDIEASYRR
jgi:H+/Cl- antiporter ClcA